MSRAGRNKVSRKAAKFLRHAVRAWEGLEQGRKYFVAFSQIGRDADAEEARVNMHARVDAFCDAQRSADKSMGGANE